MTFSWCARDRSDHGCGRTARLGRRPYKSSAVARSAALGGEQAVVKGGKRGGACLIAYGCSSSDAVCATGGWLRETIEIGRCVELAACRRRVPADRFAYGGSRWAAALHEAREAAG